MQIQENVVIAAVVGKGENDDEFKKANSDCAGLITVAKDRIVCRSELQTPLDRIKYQFTELTKKVDLVCDKFQQAVASVKEKTARISDLESVLAATQAELSLKAQDAAAMKAVADERSVRIAELEKLMVSIALKTSTGSQNVADPATPDITNRAKSLSRTTGANARQHD